MTPAEIEVALHYYYRVDDHAGLSSGVPAVQSAISKLFRSGLLQCARGSAAAGGRNVNYVKTEALDVYVEALKAVPLPVQRWVIPETQ